MRNTISKAIVAGVAALSLATAVVATAEPASAAQWHGGGGGWHGGGGWQAAAAAGMAAAGAAAAAVLAPRLLARRHLVRRLVGSGGRGWRSGGWRARDLSLLGRGYGYGYGGGCWQCVLSTARTACVSATGRSTSASNHEGPADRKGLAQSGALSFAAPARRRPPVIGSGTPVVVGKDSGAPRRERRAR